MLNLTETAVQKLKEVLKQGNITDQGVRIFVSAGGWRPSLAMGVAPAPEDGDLTLEKDGLKIFLDKEANNMLLNATIDFSNDQGFAITGMNQSSCACPTSGSSCQ